MKPFETLLVRCPPTTRLSSSLRRLTSGKSEKHDKHSHSIRGDLEEAEVIQSHGAPNLLCCLGWVSNVHRAWATSANPRHWRKGARRRYAGQAQAKQKFRMFSTMVRNKSFPAPSVAMLSTPSGCGTHLTYCQAATAASTVSSRANCGRRFPGQVRESEAGRRLATGKSRKLP
jgi:hypothetical protein